MKHLVLCGLLAMAVATALPTHADEVEDSIREGLEAYGRRDLGTARQALEQAVQLLAQKNADRLGAILPAPLAGWTAEDGEAQTSAAGMALLGGGIQASRTYRRGDASVEIQVIGDSPLVAQLIPVISSPALAASMGRLVRVGSARAIQTQDGKLMMVVANRFLISVEGSASAEDKQRYAGAIDLAALERL
ncbi:hypothetical protein GXW78_20675 [Roseomonas terrae]|uniref:Uncharacterized protein n=1 Tax=Neoroseomonas terrae TaxID=424799 RepID=A0ABS5EM42_9PROT|nr:hypothetical protein [Neoroseomonas terrae]MBR0652084.1 hypothetical protein [Neoroseomonas terrae]